VFIGKVSMANITISGCVYYNMYDPTNRLTGKVVFNREILNCCSSFLWTGCIVGNPEDVHYGMVEITSYGGLCDDKYYGCVNPETNRFEIIIPEECALGVTIEFEGVQDPECAYYKTVGSAPPVDWYRYSAGLAGYVNGRHTLQQVAGCKLEKIIRFPDISGLAYFGGESSSCSEKLCEQLPWQCSSGCPGCGINGYCLQQAKSRGIKIQVETFTGNVLRVSLLNSRATIKKSYPDCGCSQCNAFSFSLHDVSTTPCNSSNECTGCGYKILPEFRLCTV